jgi:hypothetical protein
VVTSFTSDKSQHLLIAAITRYNSKIGQRIQPTVPIDQKMSLHVSMDDDRTERSSQPS